MPIKLHILLKWKCLTHYCICILLNDWKLKLSSAALTSPIEYQRNHVGSGVPGGLPSSSSSTGGLPGGSSSIGSSSMGVGGGGGSGGPGNSSSSSLCGPRSRPSRIPQPSSRLPQPVHHHHPPGPDGPDRSAGMWPPCHPQSHPSNSYSDRATNGEPLGSEFPKMKRLELHGNNSNNSNKSSGSYEDTQKHPAAGIPQMAVAPLNLTLKSPRVGTVSPLISPQSPAGGKEAFIPSSQAHKGNLFWAVVPPMPSSVPSRPSSLSYPSDSVGGGDSLGRGGHCTPSHHRQSTHNKDIDRMSTCSSTSEQSIQSIQSNGVRCQVGPGLQWDLTPLTCH